MKKIYVIGSGFGGISAALRMRSKGYDVTLLERGKELGGRARVFKQGGHTFDAGPTVITAPHLINELFELFGKNPKDYIQIIPLDHWYRYQFEDGSQFDYVKNEEQLLNNIETIASKEDAEGFQELLRLAEKLFLKGFTELSDKPFFSLSFMLKHAPALIRLKFYRSVYNAVSKHIKSHKLRRVFTTQPLLVGGNPFKTTSIYLLILHLEKKYGCHFSMGGTHSLIKGLEQLMREVGIKIRFNATVTAINGKKNKLHSITINNAEVVECNQAIYNGDPAYAYHHLIDHENQRFLPKPRLKRLKYSMGLCLYYFGTDRVYDDIALHTISYGKAYKSLLKDVFHKQKINQDLSLYLYRPTAVDKTLAPEGCDSFYVLAPVPNLKADINWSKTQLSLKANIIQLLESRLLPDVSKHIRTEKFLTPKYFQEELLSQYGSGFSIQPTFTQSAYFRFHNRAIKLKGLFFVGAGTHPGAGVPGVLSSAKLVDQLIPNSGSTNIETIKPKKMLAHYGKSFNWAALILSKQQRAHAQCIYAFCRYIDDIADEMPDKVQAKRMLLKIKKAINSQQSDHIIIKNMIVLMGKLDINPKIIHQLIDGISWDLENNHIANIDALIRYSYGVASTVGLLMCSVFRALDKSALRYAIDLGIGMQLTNIARDVIEDAQRGRIYLPQNWFTQGLDSSDILYSKNIRLEIFTKILKLLEIAEHYYQSAEKGISYLPSRVRLSILTASKLYNAIGKKIQLLNSDEYWSTLRVSTTKVEKIRLSLKALGQFKFLKQGKYSHHHLQLCIEDLINDAI